MIGSNILSVRKNAVVPARVGIIGLDTSHSIGFTRLINNPEESTGYKVVAAYPYGSRTIEFSYSRIPRFTEEIKEMGVEIVDSIDELLAQTDVILLLTHDGNPHLEQALQVMETGKTMFIDKPFAGSLKDVVSIIDASKKYDNPIFSSSAVRYMEAAQTVRYNNRIGEVLGADVFGPATLEESHPDLYWYGIHGVELLFTVMGTGCKSVTRTKADGTDIVVGNWENDRVGTFRGIRDGKSGYGGTAYGSDSILSLGNFQEGYAPLVNDIIELFNTGIPPVSLEETLEIYTFMSAADESKRQGGAPVTFEEVLSKNRT